MGAFRMETQRYVENCPFLCLDSTKYEQLCRNVIGQKRYNPMLIEWVGTPSKAGPDSSCPSEHHSFLLGMGQEWNGALTAYSQTRQVRSLWPDFTEKGGGKISKNMFRLLWQALGDRGSGFYLLPWGIGILIFMASLGKYGTERQECPRRAEKNFCYWGLHFGVLCCESQRPHIIYVIGYAWHR